MNFKFSLNEMPLKRVLFVCAHLNSKRTVAGGLRATWHHWLSGLKLKDKRVKLRTDWEVWPNTLSLLNYQSYLFSILSIFVSRPHILTSGLFLYLGSEWSPNHLQLLKAVRRHLHVKFGSSGILRETLIYYLLYLRLLCCNGATFVDSFI